MDNNQTKKVFEGKVFEWWDAVDADTLQAPDSTILWFSVISLLISTGK